MTKAFVGLAQFVICNYNAVSKAFCGSNMGRYNTTTCFFMRHNNIRFHLHYDLPRGLLPSSILIKFNSDNMLPLKFSMYNLS